MIIIILRICFVIIMIFFVMTICILTYDLCLIFWHSFQIPCNQALVLKNVTNTVLQKRKIQSKDPHPPTEFYFPYRLTDLSQINPFHRDRAPPHQRWLIHISTEQQLIPFSGKKGPITDFDSRREILDLRLSRKSANPVSRPNKSCLFLAQICRHWTAGQFANAGKNLTVDHQIDLARLWNSYDLD